MLLGLLMVILVLAWLTSVATIVGSTIVSARQGTSDKLVDVVGGFGSAALWGVAALGASGVTVVRDSGAPYAQSEPMLVAISAVFGALMAIVGITGTTFLIDVRDITVP